MLVFLFISGQKVLPKVTSLRPYFFKSSITYIFYLLFLFQFKTRSCYLKKRNKDVSISIRSVDSGTTKF